jgi:hypothetical protein
MAGRSHLLWRHELDIELPAGVTAFLDVLVEVALSVVRVAPAHKYGLVVVETLCPLTGEPVVLCEHISQSTCRKEHMFRTLMKTDLPSRFTQRKVWQP